MKPFLRTKLLLGKLRNSENNVLNPHNASATSSGHRPLLARTKNAEQTISNESPFINSETDEELNFQDPKVHGLPQKSGSPDLFEQENRQRVSLTPEMQTSISTKITSNEDCEEDLPETRPASLSKDSYQAEEQQISQITNNEIRQPMDISSEYFGNSKGSGQQELATLDYGKKGHF